MFATTNGILILLATIIIAGPYFLYETMAQENDEQHRINERHGPLHTRSWTTSAQGGPTYPSVIAQATCTALSPLGFSAAIKRNCGSRVTCAAICRSKSRDLKRIMGNQGANRATCFNALHFYRHHPSVFPTDTGKAHMIMYKYGSGGCHVTYCGPNFCCCKL